MSAVLEKTTCDYFVKPTSHPSSSSTCLKIDFRLSLDDTHGITSKIVSTGIFKPLLGGMKSAGARAKKERRIYDITSIVLANALRGHLKGLAVTYSRSRPRRARESSFQTTPIMQDIDSRLVKGVVDRLSLFEYLESYVAPPNDAAKLRSWFKAGGPLLRLLRRTRPIDTSGLLKFDTTSTRFVRLRDFGSCKAPLVYGETADTNKLEVLGRLFACVTSSHGLTTSHRVPGPRILPYEWFTSHFTFKGDWSHHGRFYHPLSEWKIEHRKRLVVNGHPTVELDFKALHIQLLYASFTGNLYAGDPYKIPVEPYTLDARYGRALGKLVCNVGAINCDSTTTAVHAVNAALNGYNFESQSFQKSRYDDLAKWLRDNGISINRLVIESFVSYHHPISGYLLDGNGLLLQRMDSLICVRVLERFLRNGLWIVPFHDSFRVAIQHERLLRDTMKEAFEAETGVSITDSEISKR